MNRSGGWQRRGEVFAVVAAAMALELLLFDRFISPMDEGHLLQFADVLRKGGALYRDAALYPLPGAFYLLELAFEAFGPSIRVARWLVVVEFTLFAAFSYLLLRTLLAPRTAVVSVVVLLLYRMWAFPHWQVYSYSTSALCALTLAFFAMARALELRRVGGLALAGFLLGLGILCKQDFGAASMLAMNAVLLAEVASGTRSGASRLAPFAWLNTPVLLVGLATALHFLDQGILGDALQQTVLAHLTGIQTFDYTTLPPLFPLFEQNPALKTIVHTPTLLFEARSPLFLFHRNSLGWDLVLKAFYYLPYAIVAGGGLRLWVQRSKLREAEGRARFLRELMLWTWGTSFLLLFTLNRPQDFVHLAVLYWPFLALGLVYTDDLLHVRGKPAAAAVAVVLLPLTATAIYTGILAGQIRAQHSEPLPGERAGIFTTPENVSTLQETVTYIQQRSRPDDPVAILPYFPLASFLAERNAPDRSGYIVWPVPIVPTRESDIIDAMERSRVDLVVYDFSQVPYFPPMQEFSPALFQYLVDRFEIDAVFNGGFWSPLLVGLRRQPEAANEGTSIISQLSSASLQIASPQQPTRIVAGTERDAWLRIGVWPFRPSVALRPSPSPARTILSAPLEVPADSRLRTAVSVHPRRWVTLKGSWVEFELAIVVDGRRESLFSRRLEPYREPDDRVWVDVDVSLGAYAGRSVVLELSTQCENQWGESLDMGGWEIPRLVTMPET